MPDQYPSEVVMTPAASPGRCSGMSLEAGALSLPVVKETVGSHDSLGTWGGCCQGVGVLLSALRSSHQRRRPSLSRWSLLGRLSIGGWCCRGEPGTRANPYPRGQKAMVEKFSISVVGVDANAWPRLKRASSDSVAPRLGMTYVLVMIGAKNEGRTESIPLLNGVPAAISATQTGSTAHLQGAVQYRRTSRVFPASHRGAR